MMKINKETIGTCEVEWYETKSAINILWVLNRQRGNGDFPKLLAKFKALSKKLRIKWVSHEWLKDYLVRQGFKKEKNDDYIYIRNLSLK